MATHGKTWLTYSSYSQMTKTLLLIFHKSVLFFCYPKFAKKEAAESGHCVHAKLKQNDFSQIFLQAKINCNKAVKFNGQKNLGAINGNGRNL